MPTRVELRDHQPHSRPSARCAGRPNGSFGVAPRLGLALLVGIGSLFCVTGCFDVKRVDVTGLEIDNFEDGDQVPRSDQFETWHCFEYESALPDPTCLTTAPGFQSQRAESLTFELGAPLNGDDSSVGVGLGVFTLVFLPVDLGQWQRLKFDAKFAPSDPAASDATLVWIRLKCPDLASQSVSGGLMIQQQVMIGREWSTFSRDLGDPGFAQPPYQRQLITIEAADCLTLVDAVTFEIQRTDGQAGTLTIDNVRLE